ncbi:hypothetical protein L6452_36755 [Arctium lappa]|uniref:Uncharacterized protein n=1 Tax=Arctium lappa TaxID=4217 RepID=A0ACB8Y1S6_ARCLA|nr:hypothetical protein L6452_36755 [Arctium lappa]
MAFRPVDDHVASLKRDISPCKDRKCVVLRSNVLDIDLSERKVEVPPMCLYFLFIVPRAFFLINPFGPQISNKIDFQFGNNTLNSSQIHHSITFLAKTPHNISLQFDQNPKSIC